MSSSPALERAEGVQSGIDYQAKQDFRVRKVGDKFQVKIEMVGVGAVYKNGVEEYDTEAAANVAYDCALSLGAKGLRYVFPEQGLSPER